MPSAAHVRHARQYLRKHAKATVSDISPQKFAAASQETGSSFGDLLKFISRLYAGGQGADFQRSEQINAIAEAGGK